MKLMRSLPQQIIITHTNSPHLKPCCKNEKQQTSKTSSALKKKIIKWLPRRVGDESCSPKIGRAKAF